MLFKLFRVPPPKNTSIIKEVHITHKPSIFFSGYRKWRHSSMEKTLDWITDSSKLMELQTQAQANIKQWSRNRISSPNLVEVVYKDWGVAAFEATKKHGVTYSVLNMANSIFPGGAALEGGSAQEENMWHRSTCALSLLDEIIYLDKEFKMFRYNETATRLLDAQIKMTDAELEILEECGEKQDSSGYKVFFSREPRVCFRGPEVMLISSGFEDPGNRIDKHQSYSFLSQSDVFPFYELRSAAPEFSIEPRGLDHKELEQYKGDLRRRIAAQLDTLIIEGKRNVILGAWGCGAFKNDPHRVAEIYCEEIEKRANFFDHIVFPIINTGPHDNHGIFERHLSGMKLGNAPAVDNGLKL
ncbi:poly(ADP-ribose) glycohydrolase domain-containing protein [Fluoribacter gormanii]|uniref:poly(ADP-ribose) glycohydrolase domain-containing protein n=1 Tax=Fluoribacter gormanii TaxID=464 RepID=UPI001040F34A|nr:poly(ADP-ribose) glycohydrolase domain-containing protein [Fluoribacter gormanii]